jgi:S1-C subfamily serine protease
MRLKLLLSLLLVSAVTVAPLAQRGAARRFGQKFTRASQIVLTERSLLKAFPIARPAPLAGRSIRSRGGVEIFAKVAPSVVVVRTDVGHGTGWVVDPAGFIITNHHVVEEGLRHDTTGSYAMINTGKLQSDGTMLLDQVERRAFVYKIDPTRDLSLLKIEGTATWPALALSDTAPRPGLSITIVGHPAAGMLWSIRPGQIASVGQMPGDMVDYVMAQLAASGDERASVAAQIMALPKRRILLTSAPVNPGDSGGPVVDDTGKVVGVTFAVPADPALSKLSYHIHLDELRAFLAQRPARPMLITPDPWDIGARVELVDLDKDGRPDVLAAGNDEEGPDTLMFDLDGDTPRALLGPKTLDQLVAQQKFDFEAAVHVVGDAATAFYDSNNDGEIDLIITENADHQIGQFTRPRGGAWSYAPARPNVNPVSGSHLQNPMLAARFDALLKRLQP